MQQLYYTIRKNHFAPVLIFLTAFFSLSSHTYTTSPKPGFDPVGRMSDSLELVSFHNSLNGAIWLEKWDLEQSMDTWKGIALNDEGRVIAIHLPSNRLFGPLLTDLNLPFLSEFVLIDNKINGSIPDFTGLPMLNSLELSDNDLTGTIPDFSSIPNLIFFNARNNELTGELPNFTNLPNLQILELFLNQISGAIPDFSNLPSLETLDIRKNPFSGLLPDFSNLPNLKVLSIGGAEVTGNLPDFSNLPELEVLSIEETSISGSIPDFSNLPKLTELFIIKNRFSGEVPDFSNTPALITLILGDNLLEGPAPDFSNLPILTTYDIGYNLLEGLLPDFKNLPRLQSLSLEHNRLSGVIPDFGHLENLELMNLNANAFSGQVPDFSNLPRLSSLHLGENSLDGGIPDFTNLPRLQVLILDNNTFKECPRFSQTPLLEVLKIQGNQLTFEDVLRNFDQIQDYTYQFQSTIPLPCPFINKSLGQDLSIQLPFDHGLADSKYEWFESDQPYLNIQGQNRLDFYDLKAEDAGFYACKITNPLAPDLELWTENIELKIDEAFNETPTILTVEPSSPSLDEPVSIFYDITTGNARLADCNCDIYIHTGIITSESADQTDWKHVPTIWGSDDPKWKMSPVNGQPNVYQFDITPSIREYYDITPGVVVEKLAFVFRNADGSVAGQSEQGIDIFYPLTPLPTNSAPLKLSIGSADGGFGEQVCFDVKAQTSTTIGALDLSIQWDTTVLAFEEVAALSLANLTSGNFNLASVENGRLSLNWMVNDDPDGVSFPDESTLFQLCYTVKADDCINSLIAFSDSPQFINATSADQGCLFVESRSGIFSANCEQALMIPEASDYQANNEYTDVEGWTNYLKTTDQESGVDTILLAVKKNNRSIGTVGDGVFEVNVKKSNIPVDVTDIMQQLNGFEGIEAAYLLPYFWEVTPNFTAVSTGPPMGLRFFFSQDDLFTLSNALGSSVNPENLVFFKAAGSLPAQGVPDLTNAFTDDLQLFTLGVESTLNKWSVSDFSTEYFSATMQIETFSFGGMLAVKGPITKVTSISGLLDLRLFPNPSSGHFQLLTTLDHQEFLDLSIVDLAGKVVHRNKLSVPAGQNQQPINLEHLNSGIYFLHLRNKAGQLNSRKLVITK